VFRFVRWLFLLGVIAGLAAFVVSFHVRGQTPAHGFCRLLRNQDCFRLAERGEGLVTEARRWLDDAPQPRAAQRETARRETEAPRVSRAAPALAPGTTAGTPLDRHTTGERKALSDLLLQHGSR